MPTPKFTPLGSRQLVNFYDPANVANSFSPALNPKTQTFAPNNLRKYTETVNGTSIIIGDREYPPKEIKLTWDHLDVSDYKALAQYTIISPCVFVDNNDNGFLGVLIIDGAGQVPGKTSNVWTVQASFLVIAPYNGLHGNILSVAPPTLTASAVTTTGGFITASTTLYFWSTVMTAWGESLVSAVRSVAIPAGTNTNQFNLTFTFPVNPNAKKVRIYWNTVNTAASSTFLTEIQAGFSASYTVFSNVIAYNSVNPPGLNTAFSGYWAGGLWTPQ